VNAVSVDIIKLLNDNQFGVIGTNLFAMAWCETIDSQVLVLDHESIISPLKADYENPVFQILIRGDKNADMNTAYTLARSIYEFLIIQTRQVINSTEYLEYEPTSSVIGLGRDDNDRAIFSTNFYTFRLPI